ncbi:MAG: D-glycerate dehydrogenase [Pedobacter sp.]|nr:MAG: D-glycerate dehydrogenase [Pedobacter sp.]
MKVFITRIIPENIKKTITDEGYIVSEWKEMRSMTTQELISHCKDADALLCINQKLNADFFEQCSHLKVVATNSVGFDHIDIIKATEKLIPVGNTPDVLSKATADVAFLLMQTVARKAIFWHKEILVGNWDFLQPFKDLGFDLQGKTLGIFGLGRIGAELAKSARGAFNMPIIYHNRNRNEEAENELGAKYVTFHELLEKSDVISVHANLNDDNKGIFDKKAFNKMKETAIFINTARGGLHNEEDLLIALEDQTIGGVGLDVTNPEPMLANNRLLNHKNAVVFPHIGSATIETRIAMVDLSIKNILAGLKGERLPACVNPEVHN